MSGYTGTSSAQGIKIPPVIAQHIERLEAEIAALQEIVADKRQCIDRLAAAAKPFAESFEQVRDLHQDGQSADIQKFLDNNTVVPTSTIGQWRTLADAFAKANK